MTSSNVVETVPLLPGQDYWQARDQVQERVRVKNREVVMLTLKALGITFVGIEFDGHGDSGQITDIVHKGLIEDTDLHQVKVDAALRQARNYYTGDDKGVAVEEHTFENAYKLIEEFAYDVTYTADVDWVNNEGGYGSIEIDVGENTIKLTMNERIEIVNTSEHEV